jgi:hypothetical protein
MKGTSLLLAFALLGACAHGQFHPLEGMPVGFGESVPVGPLVASPQRVLEDSRCPHSVECVQAGRVVVSTRIDGPGGSETVPLTLGEPATVQGTTITLTSVRPEPYRPRRHPRREYRFVYETGA